MGNKNAINNMRLSTTSHQQPQANKNTNEINDKFIDILKQQMFEIINEDLFH